MSADITEMILDDHDWFRRRFLLLAELRDDRDRLDEAGTVWDELARHLEVHAAAEEEHFYPSMARRADDSEASATEDAIGDHDDIRAAARKAFDQEPGSEGWWSAVEECDHANNHHMAEEETDDLEPFRRVTSLAFRQELGAKFEQFKAEHPGAAGLDFADKDADAYVAAVTE
jgi:hypothetical protein